MLQSLKYVLILVVVGTLATSCDQYPSLQKYYVDSQASTEFIALDIPASIVSLKSEDASEEVRATLKSIKKINFLAFQITETNNEEFTAEQQKVKEILKNPKYQDLIRLGSGSKYLVVKFLGDDDAIDEVIFYGSDKEMGFAVIRVLGDKMDPSKMMALVQEINVDGESDSFKQIASFMQNMK